MSAWGKGEQRKRVVQGYDVFFKREFVKPLFEFYNRLSSQKFIRFTDEEKLFKMLDETLRMFRELIDFYSTPPESHSDVPFSEL